ncbi:PLD-like domain protein, partial [Chlamydia psittaci 84-8471/1]
LRKTKRLILSTDS